MYLNQLKEAAAYLEKQRAGNEKIAVVLGSGLSNFSHELRDTKHVSFADVPHLPVSTAPTHKGEFIFGKLNEQNIICVNGRVHYYEGYDLKTVTMYVRVLKLLGIEKIIFTNAVGSLREDYMPGDLVLIHDHLNLSGINPLRGPNLDEFGDRFIDMSMPYCPELNAKVNAFAKQANIDLKQGVYAYATGPSFETSTEIKAYRQLGADVVGMSTVPEVIVACHSHMQTVTVSCVTNYGTGISKTKLTVEDVVDTVNKANSKIISLLTGIVKTI